MQDWHPGQPRSAREAARPADRSAAPPLALAVAGGGGTAGARGVPLPRGFAWRRNDAGAEAHLLVLHSGTLPELPVI
jgi:hypothetical protein